MKTNREKKKNKEKLLSKKEQLALQRKRRQDTKKRVAACRQRKKQQNQNATPPAFSSARAMAMATARAKLSLPSTPKRRNAVRKRLYQMRYSQEAEAEDFPEQGNRKQQRGLSEETKAAIIAFYERDDVSRQAPGRKNFTTIREGSGQKRQLQTRHLTTSVREAYAFFVEANPDVSVGKSTFASLQPQNVLLSSKLPHNVCLCKYHENFIAAVNARHRAVPEFPDYSRTLPATFLCDPSTKMCWMNECNECKDGKGFQTKCRDMLSEVAADFCSWFIWKNDEDGKLAKVCEEGSIDELVEYFSGILPQFLQHIYYKRNKQHHTSFSVKLLPLILLLIGCFK